MDSCKTDFGNNVSLMRADKAELKKKFSLIV